MSPKLDKSLHQPYYKEPEPMQKHPPHLKPQDEIKLAPPPPHLPRHTIKSSFFVIAVILGTILALLVGLVLDYFKISINVILPVLVPIWIGSITLIFMINRE